MLEEYPVEIGALVVIIILVIILVISKRKKPSVKDEIIEDKSLKNISTTPFKYDEYDHVNRDEYAHDVDYDVITPTKESIKPVTKPHVQAKPKPKPEVLLKDEPVPTPVPDKETPQEFKVIQKRTVPPHGKISKDNFREFAGERILVAEDNLINQKVIKGLLADTGVEIVMADDGQDALDILEKDTNFLFILMDAHMPRVDGFEATRIIRANPNYDEILVVALSGDTASDDIKKMREAGMAEQLEKPLRMDPLYDIFYAYSGKQKKSTNEVTGQLNQEKGLEICGGDKAFYYEILSEFVDTYEKSLNLLNELMHHNEADRADRLLLDVIGVTANIGADSLHDIANEIKAKLGSEGTSACLPLVHKYQTHLKHLIVEIKKLIE
jgi:CheY-like chemotaxis protein